MDIFIFLCVFVASFIFHFPVNNNNNNNEKICIAQT